MGFVAAVRETPLKRPPLPPILSLPAAFCIPVHMHELMVCWGAERRRSGEANRARKLVEGAEREVRQLRLACIHPQMTAYWRNLSAEMQLDSVTTPPSFGMVWLLCLWLRGSIQSCTESVGSTRLSLLQN